MTLSLKWSIEIHNFLYIMVIAKCPLWPFVLRGLLSALSIVRQPSVLYSLLAFTLRIYFLYLPSPSALIRGGGGGKKVAGEDFSSGRGGEKSKSLSNKRGWRRHFPGVAKKFLGATHQQHLF